MKNKKTIKQRHYISNKKIGLNDYVYKYMEYSSGGFFKALENKYGIKSYIFSNKFKEVFDADICHRMNISDFETYLLDNVVTPVLIDNGYDIV